MLVGQTARVGKQVCQIAGVGRQAIFSVKQLGLVGRYVGRSNSWGSLAGMLVGQTAGEGSRYVVWSNSWAR